MMRNLTAQLGVCLMSLGLVGCNAGPLLQTGSISSTPIDAKPVAAKPVTPAERALHVAATSTRAKKCGFFFEPETLKANFLAAEAARGITPDELSQAEKTYVYTSKSIALKIPNAEAYCTKERTASIKTSLTAALAGNFEPPPKKVAKKESGGLLGLFDTDVVKEEKWDPNTIYDPMMNDPNKRR